MQTSVRLRPTFEQCLLLATIFAILSSLSAGKTSSNAKDLCVKPVCLSTAARVLSYMKPEINPCDDFYQFACGQFIEDTVIPDDQSSMDEFVRLSNIVQQQLRTIITEERPESDPLHLRLPNIYYKTCMNTTLIDQRGTAPMQTIADSLGGWPVIKGDTWDPSNNWSWVQATKDFERIGLNYVYIISLDVGTDPDNSSKNILSLSDPALSLNRDYLINGANDRFVKAYFDYLVNIAVLFGANIDVAKKELNESLQFEIDLAKISLSTEELNDPTLLNNKRTIKQLQESWPFVDWLDYINSLMQTGLTVDENELINVASLKLMNNLGQLLAKTPKRTIANYMMSRAHIMSISFLPEEFDKVREQYNSALYGVQQLPVRWKNCVDRVSYDIEIAVGSLYVRKYFSEEAKKSAMDMIENIRKSFNETLKTLTWMDEKTLKEALIKLQYMDEHVGYPDELLDNNKLAEYYTGLKIEEGKYWESYLNVRKFNKDQLFRKLRLPVNRTDWRYHSTPATVNAYYQPTENSIQIPAAILQGSFFNAQNPNYMNYGGIGFVIGHEITHGFDNYGSQFDEFGNLYDWWQNATKKAYEDKTKCFIQQYGNYTEPLTGLKLDGVNTLGENIADNGGSKAAYRAYKEWAKANGREQKLPGLEYTPQQMFWISQAQVWCIKYNLESLKNAIVTDPHAPGEFRVNGPLRNIKNFSQDFKCPKGSPMNPAKKCVVW